MTARRYVTAVAVAVGIALVLVNADVIRVHCPDLWKCIWLGWCSCWDL